LVGAAGADVVQKRKVYRTYTTEDTTTIAPVVTATITAVDEDDDDDDDDDDDAKDDHDDTATDEYTRSRHRWSTKRSIRENLEICFGSPLPSPATSEKADFVTECGICYVHHLPSSEDTTTTTTSDGDDAKDDSATTTTMIIPTIMCKNPSCARSYHESCLFEWLHSLPTARFSFDRIFGTCPYCCESISVKARA